MQRACLEIVATDVRRLTPSGAPRLLHALILSFLAAVTTLAAPSPKLANVLPTGGQRGTEIELSFTGDRLQDTEEIIFHEPGIQMVKLLSATNKTVKAQVRIAPDCSLGEHHLRLRTATGISELRTFFVGPYPVVAEIEPNNDPAKAQKIELNTTVTGVIKNEDVDCFRLELKRGERLSAEVEGMRLGRGVFDPRLAVLDSAGKVLADSDDTWLAMQDPFISLVVPADGAYTIRLREATYAGNDECHYRLHIGHFPRPTIVFPLGGKAGDALHVTWYSEATGEFGQDIKLPAAPQEKHGVFAELDGLLAPTPNWIRVSTFPNVLAAAPNQDREHATATELTPPFALNGILAEKGRDHWFRFRAEKGTALEATVYARRLRSPLDSVLEIFDAQGKSIASNDDSDGADSSLKFTPSESTNYFARIRDTLGHGGREFAYRIEITPVQPRLTVKIPEVARNDTQSRQFISVPQGNRFATLVTIKRSNLAGPIAFGIDALPEGVSLVTNQVAPNVDSLPLVFEATSNAPIAGKLTELTASTTNGVTGRFHQQVDLVEGPNNATYYGTGVDQLCVAVTKEAPYHLRIVEPGVPLVQAGTMRLEVVVERAPGFDEPIEVQMVWNPPGVSAQSEATIAKGQTNVFYQLNADGGAEIRSWNIAVLGHATVDGGELYVSSQLAKLEVASPFLSGKIETLWAKPGHPAKLTVQLQNLKPFEGKATIHLLGLPEKVSAPEKEFTKDDQEVTFEVTLDSKCSLGSHKNLFCAVDVKKDGHVIPHTIASGGILRIVPPGKDDTKVAAAKETKK
jgi:hypothetical protein